MPHIQVQTLYGLRDDEARYIRALILIQIRDTIKSYRRVEVASRTDNSVSDAMDTVINALWKCGNLYLKMGGDIANLHEAFPECSLWTFADRG